MQYRVVTPAQKDVGHPSNAGSGICGWAGDHSRRAVELALCTSQPLTPLSHNLPIQNLSTHQKAASGSMQLDTATSPPVSIPRPCPPPPPGGEPSLGP